MKVYLFLCFASAPALVLVRFVVSMRAGHILVHDTLKNILFTDLFNPVSDRYNGTQRASGVFFRRPPLFFSSFRSMGTLLLLFIY